jgi:aminoglycoside phosphotransferase (APT) family kinase protein
LISNTRIDLPRPDRETIQAAVTARLPHLLGKKVVEIGYGWAFWAYLIGDTVLRFPRYPGATDGLPVEASVMRELAPTLTLPVSIITVHENGPHGLPFTSHRLVPGAPVFFLRRPLAPNAGAVLGSFVRAMHAFPAERAMELGVEYESPDRRRERRRSLFEDEVVTQVFPLITETAREQVSARFDAYLCNDANFDYTPIVSQGDLDDYNVLANWMTGELTGVADWGDLTITDPAGDFAVSLYGGFARLGISVPDLLEAYGMTETDLEKMRPRCAFTAFCWPIWDILYGLETHPDGVLKRGIARLYETLQQDPR